MVELHAGTSDAVLLWLPTADPAPRTATFRRDVRAVPLSEAHRLADATSVTLTDPAEDPADPTRDRVTQGSTSEGARPRGRAPSLVEPEAATGIEPVCAALQAAP